MSAPVQKARSPAPVSTTTRISRSALDRAPDPHQLGFGRRVDRVHAVGPIERHAGDVIATENWTLTTRSPGSQRRDALGGIAGLCRARRRRLRRARAAAGASGTRPAPCQRRADQRQIAAPARHGDDRAVGLGLLVAQRLGERQHRRESSPARRGGRANGPWYRRRSARGTSPAIRGLSATCASNVA